MSLTIGQVARVFRTYQTQERIAQLNRESGFRTVQGQVDIVDISEQARQLLEEHNRSAGTAPVPAPTTVGDAATPQPDAPAPENLETPPVPAGLETASNTPETAPLADQSETAFAGV